MFRYARAQRGRYREHWQFGVEAIGSEDAAVDAEILALQSAWYRELGLGDVTLLLNSIGDAECRPAYRAELVAYLETRRTELSAESQERLLANPLRVLDSKDERDREIVRGAPVITERLCDACREHFAAVRAFLDARGVGYALEPTLVRGLDYYERTTWEFQPATSGAQSSISGGGRYDGLAEQLGGPRSPGVGFGCGVERVVLELERAGIAPPARRLDLYVAIAEPAARPRLHALLDRVRAHGLAAEADLAGRSMKGQLRQAGRLEARLLAVCGPEEWARGAVRVGSELVPLDDLVEHVVKQLEGAA
jgi:histidyl-tRNA synthetase